MLWLWGVPGLMLGGSQPAHVLRPVEAVWASGTNRPEDLAQRSVCAHYAC